MTDKTDLRVIKTKVNIRRVFIELLYEKNFEKISVQDILDAAMINRSTFYKYYDSKYDLAQKLIDEVRQDTIDFINERFGKRQSDCLFVIVQRIYEHFYARRQMILALLKIKTDEIDLSDMLQHMLKEKYLAHVQMLNPSGDASLADYHATIYAAFVLTTFKWLLASDDKEDIEKVTHDLQHMFFSRLFCQIEP